MYFRNLFLFYYIPTAISKSNALTKKKKSIHSSTCLPDVRAALSLIVRHQCLPATIIGKELATLGRFAHSRLDNRQKHPLHK